MKSEKAVSCEEKDCSAAVEDDALLQVSGMGVPSTSPFSELPQAKLIGGPLQAASDAQTKALKGALDFMEEDCKVAVPEYLIAKKTMIR